MTKLRISGDLVEDGEVIKAHAVDFFKKLYSDPCISRPHLDGWCSDQGSIKGLVRMPILEEETKKLVWDSDGDKASRLERFMMDFFKV